MQGKGIEMKAFASGMALAALTAIICGTAFADDAKPVVVAKPAAEEVVKPKGTDDWTPFQIGFFPGSPRATENSNVCGLKLGIPMVTGKGEVNGLEPSGIYSGTSYVNGFQGTIVGATIAKEVNGIQGAWFGYSQSEEVNGLQAAIGGAVVKRIKGFQAAPGAVILEKSAGCQVGFASVADAEFKGCQLGGANVATEKLSGFQLGAVNYAAHNGVQVGVINIIKDGWIPVFPGINFSFKDDAKSENK